jgi:thioredoxin:protein disulfide reductase
VSDHLHLSLTVERWRRRFVSPAIAVAALLVFAGIGVAFPLAVQVNQTGVVKIETVKLAERLVANSATSLNMTMRIQPGWHINSDQPLDQYYIATRLQVVAPAKVTVGAAVYPPAQEVSPSFARGAKLSVFSGAITVKVPLNAASDFRSDVGAPATIRIAYQACNDQECLRPAQVSATVDLASAGIFKSTDDTNVGTNGGGFANEGDVLAHVFASHGYFLGFLIVLLGGLALNLTPCVYPLIGVTVAYFGFEGGGPRKVVILALIYVLGIALMFSGVGVAVALSGGLFGSILQNPYVLGAIAAMLLALAASSFGLFALQPPQWLLRPAGVARPGYVGALVMGLGMGVVAAPCIGPIVLGLLLMVQRSGSAFFGFALFFTLAIGLGLPYVGLALAAGSIRSLPRAGEWLAWVEQLFGLVLVGLALYFLDPVVGNRVITRLLPYYAAGAGIFLGFITSKARNWRPFLIFRSALGALSVVLLVYMLLASRGPRSELTFETFDQNLLQRARAQGKPVVVDFSADWCVPCREMEHTTFVDPAVVREASGFVRLRANLTAENPQNQALIKRFNVEGVPTTVFIDSTGAIRKRRVGYVGPAEFLRYLQTYD